MNQERSRAQILVLGSLVLGSLVLGSLSFLVLRFFGSWSFARKATSPAAPPHEPLQNWESSRPIPTASRSRPSNPPLLDTTPKLDPPRGHRAYRCSAYPGRCDPPSEIASPAGAESIANTPVDRNRDFGC